MSYGQTRYRLHRVLPMRLINRVEQWLGHRYWVTRSDLTKRWLDRVAWFTTPYRGARRDSGTVTFPERWREIRYYGQHDWDTLNVRWEEYRADPNDPMRAIGLTGGTYGRRIPEKTSG